MRKLVCLSLIILLAGCSRGGQTNNEPQTYPGETPAPVMTAEEAQSAEAALAESMRTQSTVSASRPQAVVPVLKAGLWRVTYQRQEMGFSEIRQICADAGLAARLAELPAAPEPVTCSRRQVRLDDDAIRLDTVCSRNDTTITRHIVIRSPSDSSFHQTMETTYEPAFAGHGIVNTTADGTRTGDCPAGMKPGATSVVRP